MADDKPQEHEVKHLVCVGAVYIDTILTVPHFPAEDTKLRASSLTKRRGGNTPNTLEVLSQLLPSSSPLSPSLAPDSQLPLNLHLLSVLPSKTSPDTTFIQRSLPTVDFASACVYRQGHTDAARSYIIQSTATASRTIISSTTLPELTLHEFIAAVSPHKEAWATSWFHFEGRIPDVTVQCIRWLHQHLPSAKISLECEKPERVGLEAVLGEVDVLFFSRVWAERKGFECPKAFLASLLNVVREGAVVCSLWGGGGAAAMRVGGEDVAFVRVRAWSPDAVDSGHDVLDRELEPDQVETTSPERAADDQSLATEKGNPHVVDTIGAGDTFIAGMLYALLRHGDWGLKTQVVFANQVAGRKVLREGFGGFGEEMKGFSPL